MLPDTERKQHEATVRRACRSADADESCMRGHKGMRYRENALDALTADAALARGMVEVFVAHEVGRKPYNHLVNHNESAKELREWAESEARRAISDTRPDV
jgi:hypothetical protein